MYRTFRDAELNGFSLCSPITMDKEISTQRFRKEIIRTGQFIKSGEKFEITRDTLENWVTQFARMKANGVKVPVPIGHTTDAEKNRGFVDEMFIDKDTLCMIVTMRGDGIEAAVNSDVSIRSPMKITDGSGNEYLQPIEHVALVTDPVVPGLDGFTLVASRSVEKMELKRTVEVLGIKDELTEEKADEILFSRVTEIVESSKKQVTELKDKVKILEASRDKKREVDPVTVELLKENREGKLDRLVEFGKITPDVCKQLKEVFLADSALELSLSTGTENIFNKVYEAIAKNDPVKLKEVTGPQGGKIVELSKDGNDKRTGLEKDMDERAERFAKTGVVA